MKKLYLSITLFIIMILMFAITIIPTQAYTFNGSYDFSNVDINASLTELNGASLNDLFNYEYLETLPLIEWNGYRNKYEIVNGNITFNEYIYIDLGYKNLFNGNWESGLIDFTTGQEVSNTSFVRTEFINIIPNTTYTITREIISSLDTNGVRAYDIDFNYIGFLPGIATGSTTRTFTTQSNAYYIRIMDDVNVGNGTFQLEYGDLSTNFVSYGVISEIYRLNTPVVENTDLVQSLYLYNLENINIDLLNYYFAVFLLNAFDLPIGDLWSYAWTAGNDAGYNDGFTDGQNTGYNEGYIAGNEDGLIEGYNNGVDYAVQENISILSIFELIFGVALNMLTFIITIDIFGISILSLISVLSLFVGVVWILKMIRG